MSAEDLFRMLDTFRTEGMDLSIMEVRVVHWAEDINDDINEPLNWPVEMSVEEDGTSGTFTFRF